MIVDSMVKTVIWMSILPQIASVCICECAMSEAWTCFRFDRICFRERAQNLTSIRRYRATLRRWRCLSGAEGKEQGKVVKVEYHCGYRALGHVWHQQTE